MTTYKVMPGGALRGTISVPGDKSVSHRSVMLGSLALGTTCVSNFLEGEDTRATAAAFRAMGVKIEADGSGGLQILGRGLHGLEAPNAPLDLGNSGTAMRLMAGVLCGQRFDSELTGDESLNSRPMGRIVDPLRQMGADIRAQADGTAPLIIRGNQNLAGIRYDMPVASAQVKSALLFAGLYATGATSVTSPGVCRDHTERMLQGFGYPVRSDGAEITLEGGHDLAARDVQVPSDVSSAAFFLVGASIAADSDLTLTGVGMNPTRAGVVNILQMMGAHIEVLNERDASGEPVADLRVRGSKLTGIDVPRTLVANAIDEFPAIFVAAACADGETRVTGARELRVKESDRIGAMADGLAALGASVIPLDDGMVVSGGALNGGTVRSRGDHRIAMALAMAGLRSSKPVVVEDCANVATSFPNFVELAESAGLGIGILS